jgi:hypothetical protein
MGTTNDYADTEFARRLRAALAASGLTLRVTRERLVRVSLATLSYWQSGQRIPWGAASFEALTALEEILQLSPGELTDSVARNRRPGRPAAQATYSAFPDTPPIVDESLDRLGLLTDYGIDELSAHALVRVDHDRRATGVVNRQVLRATRDGASHLPALFMDDEPFAEPPQIEAVSGCRIGQRVHLPDIGFSIAEVVLAAPLPMGATAIIETYIPFPRYDVEESGEFGYHLSTRLRQCAIWVRFETLEPPVDADGWFVSADGDRREVAPQLIGSELHSVVHDSGPGRLYVRWFW